MTRNERRLWLLVVLIQTIAMCALWSIPTNTSADEVRQFHYQVVDVPGDTQALQAALNSYGSSGWELVAVAMGEIQVPRLIFKK